MVVFCGLSRQQQVADLVISVRISTPPAVPVSISGASLASYTLALNHVSSCCVCFFFSGPVAEEKPASGSPNEKMEREYCDFRFVGVKSLLKK